MENNIELQAQLRAAISAQLNIVDEGDTPIVYNMVQDAKAKERLILDIEKIVINQRIDISQAIIQIDDEYNPNHID